MLVVPVGLGLGKVGPLLGWRRRVGDLCDEEGSGSFGDAVDEDSEQRDLEEDEKADSEAEENALAVVEPGLFLLWAVADTGEVGLELGGSLASVSYVPDKGHTSSLIKLLDAK